MTFDRVRPFGTWTGTLLSAELDELDGNLANAIDGAGGGSYAPSAPITIGGSGLGVTGVFSASGGAALSGGIVADTIATSGDVTIGDDLTVSDFFTVVGNSLLAQLNVLGATDLDGTLNVDGATTLNTATVTLLSAFAASVGSLTVTGTTVLNGAITLEKRMAIAAGGGIDDLVYALPDSNASVNVTQGSVFSAHAIGMSARTYTITATGAAVGSPAMFVNATGVVHTVKDFAGNTLGTLAAASGFQLGKLRLIYSSNGTTNGWLAV